MVPTSGRPSAGPSSHCSSIDPWPSHGDHRDPLRSPTPRAHQFDFTQNAIYARWAQQCKCFVDHCPSHFPLFRRVLLRRASTCRDSIRPITGSPRCSGGRRFPRTSTPVGSRGGRHGASPRASIQRLVRRQSRSIRSPRRPLSRIPLRHRCRSRADKGSGEPPGRECACPPRDTLRSMARVRPASPRTVRVRRCGEGS